MRPISFAVFHALIGSLCFICCTTNTPEATSSPARSQASTPAPHQLPDDYEEDSAPKPPPNHDGGLERDAGTDLQSAIPYKDGARPGRIGEDDEGDGWVLIGEPGERLDLRVHNQSADTLLYVEFQDAQGRPLHFPEPTKVYAKDQVDYTLELPRGDDSTHILLIVHAERPLDYLIETKIF